MIGSLIWLGHKLIDGLIGGRGRLAESHLIFGARHPIILSDRHDDLFVQQMDAVEGHAPKGKRFWIFSKRAGLKRAIKGCMQCRRHGSAMGTKLVSLLSKRIVRPGWWPFGNTRIKRLVYYVQYAEKEQNDTDAW